MGLHHFLIAGAAVLAVVYLAAFTARDASREKSAIKSGSVAALALAALVLDSPAAIVAGLALGAVGDFFLSRRGESAFLAGMAAFALGHLAYAGAFVQSGGWPAVVPALALILLAASTEWWLAPHAGGLRWPVRGYVLVITLMGLAALALPERYLAARIGAGLFILSDLMLAFQIFVVKRIGAQRILGHLLWISYWGAQALILLGSVRGFQSIG
ncbi:MAG: lysoplasmalogenase [Paracoccaceae bacterium]